ncbi:MAG: diacylglycerol kinase family lipid kinase [Acidobacteriota bacterium]|nr:diacylglycerol kinase family lipid kinase [Acidobacteriota bacterium]
MRLLVVYNPTAGRGRAQRRIRVIETELRRLGAEVELYATQSSEDLTRACAEGSRDARYERVVICGGDGSLNYAVREFDLARGTLAVLPLGSGDDFASVLRIPKHLREACALIIRGNTRAVDVALANGIRYLGIASLGFDSEVNEYANGIRYLGGSLVYVYAALRLLPRLTPRRVRIDGKPDQPITFAVVANSRQYGGGILIVPDAQIDDGQLDCCIVHEASRWQLLMTMPKAYSGAHVKSPLVEIRRGAEFRFDSDESMKVYADGERLTKTPVTLSLAAEKLRIVAPD